MAQAAFAVSSAAAGTSSLAGAAGTGVVSRCRSRASARALARRVAYLAVVAIVRETYEGWDALDYQRAHLRLRRAARDRLRDLTIKHQRETD